MGNVAEELHNKKMLPKKRKLKEKIPRGVQINQKISKVREQISTAEITFIDHQEERHHRNNEEDI